MQYYYYNMLMGLLIVQPPEAVERDPDSHMPLQKESRHNLLSFILPYLLSSAVTRCSRFATLSSNSLILPIIQSRLGCVLLLYGYSYPPKQLLFVYAILSPPLIYLYQVVGLKLCRDQCVYVHALAQCQLAL